MNETVETALIVGIVPVSLFGFLPTWLKHRNFRLGAIFLVGLILIMASQFAVGHHHDLSVAQILSQSEPMIDFIVRTLSMIAGVSMLAYATYKNNRHTHVCSNPHHHH